MKNTAEQLYKIVDATSAGMHKDCDIIFGGSSTTGEVGVRKYRVYHSKRYCFDISEEKSDGKYTYRFSVPFEEFNPINPELALALFQPLNTITWIHKSQLNSVQTIETIMLENSGRRKVVYAINNTQSVNWLVFNSIVGLIEWLDDKSTLPMRDADSLDELIYSLGTINIPD